MYDVIARIELGLGTSLGHNKLIRNYGLRNATFAMVN